MQDLPQLIAPLLDLCLEAGQLICSHYHAPDASDYETKDDRSPLTLADTRSHALLQAGLQALAPSIPMLSEESPPAAVAQRRDWDQYWLVDPLDGTREFLARTGEFTVNIALIRDHRPVLGILYLPLQQVAYVGIPGTSAGRYQRRPDGGWDSFELAARKLEPGRDLAVLVSRRHHNSTLESCMAWLRRRWGPVERRDSGSALKFCQLARGEGDIYPRFSPCCEWDTAAGQAVLEAAGGSLLGMDGRPLRYNCHDSLLSPHFYAIADSGHPLWRELLEAQLP